MKTETAIRNIDRPGTFGLDTYALKKVIGNLAVGTLHIMLPDGRQLSFEGESRTELSAQWHITDSRAIRRLVTGGALGFAEAYLDGDWTTPSLPALMLLAAHNDNAMAQRTQGMFLPRLVHRLQHIANSNSRGRARRNIAYHYDLGNDFYSAWLDPSMTYSSALFTQPDLSLQQAQHAKLDRLIEIADIRDECEVLEIGCGWGSFLERASARTAGQLTGISISARQCEYARQRLIDKHIANAQIEFRDYRDMQGSFDRIVSIEMFEAVGESYWQTYAHKVKQLLKHGGKAAFQVITIDEARFEQYRGSADFIQRYIFPGGMLPSKERLNATFEDAGMQVTSSFAFGHDYARTLDHWRTEFHAAWPALRKLGFDERFKRMWDYYYAYCEAGFLSGSIDVVQIGVEHA